MIYDVDYFIKKFEAIPEDKWTTGNFERNGQCCALGHCGRDNMGRDHNPNECHALIDLATPVDTDDPPASSLITLVNDGVAHYLTYGNNPRQRVLNFLKELKKKEIT